MFHTCFNLFLYRCGFSLEFYNMFKGNPNFQGILNWIIQILYYHCRKQHKNIEKLTDYWTKCRYLSALLSIYCNLCFLHLCQQQDFFSSWTVLSEFYQKWLFVPYIVSFSGLKMAFFKLSLAKYHCLHKKHDYVFNYYRMSLQIFFFINSSVQIFLELN